MTFNPQHLFTALSQWPTPACYWIAYSGGRDSHVLLHAMAQLPDQLQAPIRAIHINHGLQTVASSWPEHCQQICDLLHIPLEQHVLNLQPAKGESLEAQAREARYRAIAASMQAGDLLLTAHHQDDQVETLLLQLLRGAGVNGLAAMPALAGFGPGHLGRPLLKVTASEIQDYAQAQGLEWIEDPSNQSNSFDRNFLRNEVVPGMVNRWPGMGSAIARSASHCAEASQTIEAMAKMDLARVQPGDGETINIPALQELPGHRAKGVLRQWIIDRNFRLPNTARLERVLTEVVTAAEDRQPVVAWDGAEIRRYRDNLYLIPPQPEVPEAYRLGWDGASDLDLPFGIGRLVLREAAWGLSETLLAQGGLEIRFNIQGVSCRPAGRSGTRTLKKVFQEYAVPNWLRSQTPLIYQGDDLVAVAGLCVCHEFATEFGFEPIITR